VISNELSVTMGLCGVNRIDDINQNILVGYQN
jgi:isopentenyl diphosphate isomerase/L-lactate dehydrogenase-like FMN-dependent dehydrogenase